MQDSPFLHLRLVPETLNRIMKPFSGEEDTSSTPTSENAGPASLFKEQRVAGSRRRSFCRRPGGVHPAAGELAGLHRYGLCADSALRSHS